MSSIVTIANVALIRVGTKTITDIGQNTVEAETIRAMFDPVLEAELRSHAWNCAITRKQLAPQGTQTVFGELYQYTLPLDCLRPLITEGVDWVVEGRAILTTDYPVLDLRYIYKLTDLRQADALFKDALAARLAVEICEKINKTLNKKQQLIADYNEIIKKARKVDAFEKRYSTMPESEWITARY
jgi:hypothetical protein